MMSTVMFYAIVCTVEMPIDAVRMIPGVSIMGPIIGKKNLQCGSEKTVSWLGMDEICAKAIIH